MNRSMPGFPVHHQLPKFTQTHGHRVSDAIQSSHPLSFPSPLDHILSELSTMTLPYWVALPDMAHIELDKAVVHVISLVSFL